MQSIHLISQTVLAGRIGLAAVNLAAKKLLPYSRDSDIENEDKGFIKGKNSKERNGDGIAERIGVGTGMA